MLDRYTDGHSFLRGLTLSRGAHARREQGTCAMEAVSWLAGLEHSDNPDCTCPVIAAYVQALNDRMDDVTRQRLKPFLALLIGTWDPGLAARRAGILGVAAFGAFLPALMAEVGGRNGALARYGEGADVDLRAAVIEGQAAVERLAWADCDGEELGTLTGLQAVPPHLWSAIEALRAARVFLERSDGSEAETRALSVSAASVVIGEAVTVVPALVSDALDLLARMVAVGRTRSAA